MDLIVVFCIFVITVIIIKIVTIRIIIIIILSIITIIPSVNWLLKDNAKKYAGISSMYSFQTTGLKILDASQCPDCPLCV